MGTLHGNAVHGLLYSSIDFPIYLTRDDMAFVDAEHDDISKRYRDG